MPTRRRRIERMSASLVWRLPLLIAALILAVLATFVWVAYREVEHGLLQAAGVRALAASDQLALLLAQSAQQRLAEVRRTAATPVVRECVAHPSPAACEAARAGLAPLAGTIQTTIELWTKDGERVLSAAFPKAKDGTAIPGGVRPAAAGVAPLRISGGVIYSEAIAELTDDRLAGSDDSTPPPLGFIVIRRPAVANPTGDMLNRLVGNGASVEIGNRAGDVWTNLTAAVAPPAVDLKRVGVTDYRTADGDGRIAALSEIRGTPWAVWVEFPHQTVIAPANAFLRRMLLIALGFLVVSAVVGSIVSARITMPLHALTRATEAIAAGQYSHRVEAHRRDEIGRLGAAFNAMTERIGQVNRSLEDRVRERTEDLDRFFSVSLDLLCIAGLDGIFERVNPAWERVLGWTPEELTATPYAQFVHPDDVASTAAEAGKLAQGQLTVHFENRYRCKDGSYRWLSWKAAAVPASGRIYAAARDITARKRMERELQERVDELGLVNRELEAFTYSVSHDLRAPLRHISGFAALLKDSADQGIDETSRRHLKTIIDAAARMGRLIDDLLAFSRVGRTTLSRTHVDLNQLVSEARKEASEPINGRPVDWRIAPLPAVDADPSLLRLVLINLLSNALKYSSTRPRSEIEIGTAAGNGDEIVVFVRDNGVGFDMKYENKLFGVFQRLHNSDDFEGTGIGLANVRRIIQRHGGRTWAEGTVGHGATFYFSLPAQNGGERRDA